MYCKKIGIPFHIQQYEACLRRLFPSHRAKEAIENRYQKSMAGFRGEQSIAYFLDYLPNEEFLFFHNLRLPDSIHFFQIDWLIMSSRFFLILEVKNIVGKLTFDHDMLQMIREIDGKTDVFDDPVLQAERLEQQLQKWFSQRFNTADYPGENRVVITSSAQLQIEGSKDSLLRKIIRKSVLGNELDRMNKNYAKNFILQPNLQKIADQLLASHHPLIINLFSSIKFLFPEDIIKGVQCPDCGHFHMRRRKRNWYCEKCSYFSQDAHLAALRDYLLIFGPTITNKQCRDFLMLQSDTVAKKILQAVSSHYEGENRGRVYHLSFNMLKSLH